MPSHPRPGSPVVAIAVAALACAIGGTGYAAATALHADAATTASSQHAPRQPAQKRGKAGQRGRSGDDGFRGEQGVAGAPGRPGARGGAGPRGRTGADGVVALRAFAGEARRVPHARTSGRNPFVMLGPTVGLRLAPRQLAIASGVVGLGSDGASVPGDVGFCWTRAGKPPKLLGLDAQRSTFEGAVRSYAVTTVSHAVPVGKAVHVGLCARSRSTTEALGRTGTAQGYVQVVTGDGGDPYACSTRSDPTGATRGRCAS